jgi:hypothetical protein
MAPNPFEPDEIGDILSEDLLQILSDCGLNLQRGRYKCSECGDRKTQKKDVNGKPVFIPHCCPALLARVQKRAKNGDMDISKKKLQLLFNELKARMRADRQADQSKKPRGPYLCGMCRKPKKGHICDAKRTSKKET